MDIVYKILTKLEFIQSSKPELAEMYMRIAEKCDECLQSMAKEEQQRNLVLRAFEKVEHYLDMGDEKTAIQFIDIAKRAAATFKEMRLNVSQKY